MATMIKASAKPPTRQSESQCAPLTNRAEEKIKAMSQTQLCIRKRFVRQNENDDDRLMIVDIKSAQIRLTAACSPGQLK